MIDARSIQRETSQPWLVCLNKLYATSGWMDAPILPIRELQFSEDLHKSNLPNIRSLAVRAGIFEAKKLGHIARREVAQGIRTQPPLANTLFS